MVYEGSAVLACTCPSVIVGASSRPAVRCSSTNATPATETPFRNDHRLKMRLANGSPGKSLLVVNRLVFSDAPVKNGSARTRSNTTDRSARRVAAMSMQSSCGSIRKPLLATVATSPPTNPTCDTCVRHASKACAAWVASMVHHCATLHAPQTWPHSSIHFYRSMPNSTCC